MGSLLAGWDSHKKDPNVVKYMRNNSLTKEEIESFWKSKKLKEDEHLRDISLLSPRTTQEILFEEAKTASSDERDKSVDQIIRKNGWWMSSKWAFLNERPVIGPDGTGRKYASS